MTPSSFRKWTFFSRFLKKEPKRSNRPKYKLSVTAILEYGQRKDAEGRPHQEDALFPPLDRLSPSDCLFILCDGMGGHDAGEVASATVCEAMSSAILSACPEAEGSFPDALFLQALSEAYDALDKKDTGAPRRKIATTYGVHRTHSRSKLTL